MRLHAIVEDLPAALRAVEGGATVVQLRRKNATTEELVEEGEGFRELPVTFVVNDDVEVAFLLDADGVYFGRFDEGAERAVAAGLLLGISAVSVDEARAGEALGAGYLCAGPVWDSPSKPDADPAIGLDGLAAICDAASIPVVAIGGVDASNAADCIRAGAAGVAVIRAADDARALRAVLDAAL